MTKARTLDLAQCHDLTVYDARIIAALADPASIRRYPEGQGCRPDPRRWPRRGICLVDRHPAPTVRVGAS